MKVIEIIEGSQHDSMMSQYYRKKDAAGTMGLSNLPRVHSLRPKARRMYNPSSELEKDWKTHRKTTPTWFVPKDFSKALVKKFPEIKNMSAEQQLDVQTKLYNKYIQTYNPGGAPELPGRGERLPMHSTKHKTPVIKSMHLQDQPDAVDRFYKYKQPSQRKSGGHPGGPEMDKANWEYRKGHDV